MVSAPYRSQSEWQMEGQTTDRQMRSLGLWYCKKKIDKRMGVLVNQIPKDCAREDLASQEVSASNDASIFVPAYISVPFSCCCSHSVRISSCMWVSVQETNKQTNRRLYHTSLTIGFGAFSASQVSPKSLDPQKLSPMLS